MKRLNWIGLTLVLWVALTTSPASAGVIVQAPEDLPVASATDSTSQSLANGASDTTQWVDLRFKNFPNCGFIGHPLIKLVIASNMATGDTLGLTTQYSDDQTNIFSVTEVAVIGASPQSVAVYVCDTNANQPQFGYRYQRYIIQDDDVTRTAAYTNMTLTPIFLEERP